MTALCDLFHALPEAKQREVLNCLEVLLNYRRQADGTERAQFARACAEHAAVLLAGA